MIELELRNHLLETKMTISYKGDKMLIDKLVVDTGAAHTLISADIVDQIGVYFKNGDSLVSSFGIGGEEYSFRKTVDYIKIGEHKMKDMKLDFGSLDGWDINGLIGLDILAGGKFVIDLNKFKLTSPLL